MDIEAGIKKIDEIEKQRASINPYVSGESVSLYQLKCILEAMRPKQQGTDPCEVPTNPRCSKDFPCMQTGCAICYPIRKDTVTLPRPVVEEYILLHDTIKGTHPPYGPIQAMVNACRKALEDQK